MVSIFKFHDLYDHFTPITNTENPDFMITLYYIEYYYDLND